MSENKETEMLNIHQRILAVMKDITYIKKDTEVGYGSSKYKAVTHDKVVSVIREYFIKHGIVTSINQINSDFHFQVIIGKEEIWPEGKSRRETGMYKGDYEVRFINADDPEDWIPCIINAHAFGNDDKNPGKAASYAMKTAILKQFLIETGEDDESRSYDFLSDTISPQDLETVKSKVAKAKPDMDKFNEVFGIVNLSEMTNEQFPRASSMLDAKIAANENNPR